MRVIFITMLSSEVSILLDNIYRNIAIFVSPIKEQFLRILFSSRDWTIAVSDITLLGNHADQVIGIAGSLDELFALISRPEPPCQKCELVIHMLHTS